MKRITIIPLVFLLCFTFSCQQGEEVAEEVGVKPLTDAQIMEIEDTLKKNYMEYYSAMMELNADDMLICYSRTNFHEILMGINAYTNLDVFKNYLVEMFDMRESQSGENLEIKVTVLSSETAYVFTATDYTINYKDGREYKGKSVQTSVWEKETEGWKITHDHFSWVGGYIKE